MKIYKENSKKKKARLNFTAPSLRTEKILHRDNIRTWSRSSVILESFVGKTFEIHNGKSFQSLFVTAEMVGLKLGSFSRTRRRGKDSRPKVSSQKGKKK